MSLNFGEIVEPSTRAFWDDYDEGDEDLVPLEPLEWEWLNEDSTELKLDHLKQLLIIEGQAIAAFVGTVMSMKSPVCRLKNVSVSVYHIPEQDLLVCLSEEKDLNAFGRITEKLAPWLDLADQVTAVSFHPSVMHKGTPAEDAEEVCFIRSINGGREKILEAPNVITGLSAGALSYRKFRDHSGTAAAYACYLDSPVIDSVSAKPILKLFKALSIDCEDSYQLKFKAGSNLYL